MINFWILYVSLIIGMIWQIFGPSSPPVEASENLPKTSKVEAPQQDGGEVAELLPRLTHVERRLNIERRVEITDFFSEES